MEFDKLAAEAVHMHEDCSVSRVKLELSPANVATCSAAADQLTAKKW